MSVTQFGSRIEREVDRFVGWYWILVCNCAVSAVLTQLRLWYWNTTGNLDLVLFGTYFADFAVLLHLLRITDSLVTTSYDTFDFSKIAQALQPEPSDDVLEEARRWILTERYGASQMAAVAAHPMNVSISVVFLIFGLLDLVIGRTDSSSVLLYLGTFNAYLLLGNVILGSGAILLVLAIGMRFLVRRASHYIYEDTITERGMLYLKSVLDDYQRRTHSKTSSVPHGTVG